MKLKELQQQFSHTLLYQNSLIAAQIKRAPSFSGDELLQIYRNNFIMGVTEALSATYQHCLSLVGEDFFNIVAREFILQHPPHENNIINYGREFSTFLRSLPQLQSVPYVAEMARFEWLLEQTSNAELQQQPFAFNKLAKVTETQLAHILLQIPTQVSLFCSEQNIQQLYQMIINDQIEQVDLQNHCYLALKKQRDFSVAIIPLDQQQFSLLQQITQHHTLGEIEPSELHSLLPILIENELINGFTIKEQL